MLYAEIFKLDRMLTKAGIPHTCLPFKSPFGFPSDGFQIRIYKDAACTKELDDCVWHSFSHGYEQGLLETFRLSECEGFETADQVFEGWKQMYAKALEE